LCLGWCRCRNCDRCGSWDRYWSWNSYWSRDRSWSWNWSRCYNSGSHRLLNSSNSWSTYYNWFWLCLHWNHLLLWWLHNGSWCSSHCQHRLRLLWHHSLSWWRHKLLHYGLILWLHTGWLHTCHWWLNNNIILSINILLHCLHDLVLARHCTLGLELLQLLW
jgi:hypothetical protein